VDGIKLLVCTQQQQQQLAHVTRTPDSVSERTWV
jgi:hypothetical protein